MPIQQAQKRPGWSVRRQGICRGFEAIEVKIALRVGAELATKVVVGLVFRILEVVLAVAGSLPDVDDGASDGLLGHHITHRTVHERYLAVMRILHDAAAKRAKRCIRGPERA
jgi:hypothetical protein